MVPPAGVQKLPAPLSFTFSSDLNCSRSDQRQPLTAWSASTTGLKATWPGRWSASWTPWAMVAGWTRASAAPLHPFPERSALSTTLSLSSRAPWTASTNRTPLVHSTSHQRRHCPLSRVWWRKKAAALLSKVWAHSNNVVLLLWISSVLPSWVLITLQKFIPFIPLVLLQLPLAKSTDMSIFTENVSSSFL